MARIRLLIEDQAQHMTLRTMLEAEGHTFGSDESDAIFTDVVHNAVSHAGEAPTILLATASQIPDAARAMRQGVWGYILVPLQPGEAGEAVKRATAGGAAGAEAEVPAEEMRPLHDIEMDYIQTVLRRCKHNQARAARILGIGRNTLWRKLKKATQGATATREVD